MDHSKVVETVEVGDMKIDRYDDGEILVHQADGGDFPHCISIKSNRLSEMIEVLKRFQG